MHRKYAMNPSLAYKYGTEYFICTYMQAAYSIYYLSVRFLLRVVCVRLEYTSTHLLLYYACTIMYVSKVEWNLVLCFGTYMVTLHYNSVPPPPPFSSYAFFTLCMFFHIIRITSTFCNLLHNRQCTENCPYTQNLKSKERNDKRKKPRT